MRDKVYAFPRARRAALAATRGCQGRDIGRFEWHLTL